ncbi:LysM peptidoglycan-binding domain-containing protein [Zhihengliuella sp.]|uniref:LysM peptidoglycan-binding domain-containing protein n=1 Tax=Zhihengliuella sp. TaxID=1954483 RepID=UPI0028120D1D|nr:LysM peptidoglycan-binding domain-containing protein [Zhihengliuella sp.]
MRTATVAQATSQEVAPSPRRANASRADVLLAVLPGCAAAAILVAARSHLGPRPWTELVLRPVQLSEAGLQSAVVIGLAGLAAVTALWWTATLTLALLGALLRRFRLPRLASGVDRLAPAHVRRIAAVVVCFNVATAPAAFGTAVGTEAPGVQRVQPTGTGPLTTAPSPHWAPPVATGQATGDVAAPRDAPEPGWRPTAPPPAFERVLGPARPDAAEVVVRPGDTLWSIAARHLGPHPSVLDVAEEWPRWYRANLHLIGADPNRLYPGMTLKPPTE